MKFTSGIADQCFSILVTTVGTPDDWHLRWSFVYSFTELNVTNYSINSHLGLTGCFHIEKGVPEVTCAKTELTPLRLEMLKMANREIREIFYVKPAKTVRRIRIEKAQQPATRVNYG